MKIIVDIPNVLYSNLQAMQSESIGCKMILDRVKKGKPLSENHGDLKDADKILDAMNTWPKFGVDANGKMVPFKDCYVPYVHYEDMVKAVYGTPVIIEAEGEE